VETRVLIIDHRDLIEFTNFCAIFCVIQAIGLLTTSHQYFHFGFLSVQN